MALTSSMAISRRVSGEWEDPSRLPSAHSRESGNPDRVPAFAGTSGESHSSFCYSLHLSPQIHLDHPLIRRHLIDCAFGEHGAFVQAGDLDAELAHEGHVVLDHHHRAIAVDLLEQLR